MSNLRNGKKIKNFTHKEKEEIKNFINQWMKFKNCYFLKPPANKSDRIIMERSEYRSLSFNLRGDVYKGDIIVNCSCRNVYCNRTLFVNDEKKRITILKKLI